MIVETEKETREKGLRGKIGKIEIEKEQGEEKE